MHIRLTIATLTVAVAAMGLSTVAEARDGRGRGHDRDQQRHSQVRRHDRDDRRQHQRGDDRRVVIVDRRVDDRRIRHNVPQPVWRNGRRIDDRNRRYHPQAGKWDNGRRGPPSWARGRDYRSYGYDRVIYVPYQEYRRHDLYAPRHGYRWVRDDAGHYLLVAIASGIISDVLYRHGF